MLSQKQLDELASKKIDNRVTEMLDNMPDDYNEIMAYGKTIGVAIREGLSAVVDEADHFSNTNVGQFTMYLIAFKVFGEQVLKLAVVIMFWLISLVVLLYMRRRLLKPSKVLVSTEGFFSKKEYKIGPSPLDLWFEKRDITDNLTPLTTNTLLIAILSVMCFIALILI